MTTGGWGGGPNLYSFSQAACCRFFWDKPILTQAISQDEWRGRMASGPGGGGGSKEGEESLIYRMNEEIL